MNFKISDIQNCVSIQTFKNGKIYFINGDVIASIVKEKSENKLALIGKVNGNYASKYSQEITILKLGYKIIVNGYCSCPVGHNCKHIVAVCLQYIEDEKNNVTIEIITQKTNPLDIWLDDIKNEEKTEQNNDYFITYRLFSKDRDKDELKFYKSKYLKNASLNSGTHLNSYKFTQDYYYADIKNSIDKEIANLISNIDFDKWGTTFRFNGLFGAVLLSELIQTSRCFYDESKEPLKLLEEVFKVDFEFKLYKGEYLLKSNIKTKQKLIKTEPPYILDKQTNTIQKVDIDMKLFEKLQKFPKIEKKQIAQAYEILNKNIKNITLKTPKELDIKTISLTPTPQLHLSSTSFRVDFLYDKFEISYNPRELKTKFFDENITEVLRDLDAEENSKKLIESFGFEFNEKLEVKLTKNQKQLNIFKEFVKVHLPALEEDGWIVKNIEDFELKFTQNSEVVIESEESNNWFNLSFNLEFNGISQPIAPLVSTILEEFDSISSMPEYINIEVEENHFVEVNTKEIAPILQTIIELFDKKDKDDNIVVSPYDAHLIANLDENIIWRGSKDILELAKKLKDFNGIKKVELPKTLNATLRDYQKDGLNWLNFLYEFNFGGILADDMGLGKTVQTLTHLLRVKEMGELDKPALIIMPTSLIANWKNEVKKFTPTLSVLSLHGSDRHERFEQISNHDILLSTYQLALRDKELFDKMEFSYIILDEAQKIKNPKTKMAIAIKEFKSKHKLALSGTPIENHLGELWSIFSFLMPGFLDSLSFFKNYYQTPIEKEHNFSRQELLNKRIKPFMIRRTKELVASELPAKSEIIKYTQFDKKQTMLYESIRVAMEEKVKQAVENKGLASSHITILDALLKLRQVCCDPSLLKLKEAQKVKESAKLELFLDLVDELLEEGRKILVFSQFTSILAIIEERLKIRKIIYSKLTGATRKREEAIEKFTTGDAKIFLISLKAGGVGLNLTEADTVIHYDPWWNPAVENQATDRAYRIGQTKAVFVYKLIVENTIEQKILELQKKKQLLQDGIYDENQQQEDTKFSGNELIELLG